MKADQSDREREPFRWCVFCDADCEVDEPDHADDCPSTTGVYPVREQDVLCPGCKQTHMGMRCVECEAEFEVGDHYTHRHVGDGTMAPGLPEAPIYEVICIGCAANEAMANG